MVSAFEDTTASNHFFISWPIKTFFPTDFNTVHDAFAVWDYAPVEAERSQIIFGCRDGYVREFDLDAISDDGLGFKSIISIGPFYGSEGSTRESIMKHLSLDLDDDSSDIKVTIISGKNHAECIDKSNRYIAERT